MTSLFRRQKDNKRYHTGYQVENIRSNEAVIIKEHSVLVGDIFAPQVIVTGMVYGYIVASEVIVESSGQIWGDICTVSIATMPGSKVHGWISSLDEGTIDLLRLGQLTIEEIPRSGEMSTDAETLAELEKLTQQFGNKQGLNSERVELWRMLQSEAATAISARVEMEQTFEAAVLETAMNIGAVKQDPEVSNAQAASDERADVSTDNTEGALVNFQLSEAENEIGRLKTQLDSVLKHQVSLQNELIWTKASLLQSRGQRDVESGNDKQMGSDLAGMAHSRHNARLQATIAERDLKLQELQGKIDTREEQLFRLKALAAKRIESLELELKRIQGKNRLE